MPFKSVSQEFYFRIYKPKLWKRWMLKYGSLIDKYKKKSRRTRKSSNKRNNKRKK